MRIGIDLDNTILCYIPLFHQLGRAREWLAPDCAVDKAAIKQSLALVAGDAEEGEQRWQQLQALAYGSCIDQADIFPGFRHFIVRMRDLDHTLVIVSHKSRYSHKDPSVDLHYWGRHTLTHRGFFQAMSEGGFGFQKEDVTFCPTREEKVATIARLKLDAFIDDLPAVFQHPQWPAGTQPLLIHSEGAAWPDAPNWFAARAAFACLATGYSFPQTTWTVKGGGNNRITGIRTNDEELAFKAFHQTIAEGRDRLDAEYRFLQQAAAHGLPVPRPKARTSDGFFMQHIMGQRPEPSEVVAGMGQFLQALDTMGRQLEPNDLLPAAHARLKLNQFIEDLEHRIQALTGACTQNAEPIYAEIGQFLDGPFARQHQEALVAFHDICRRHRLDPNQPLAPALHYPSPSDFGPHNCLQQEDGTQIFLDFEYGGWDDPAKLLCDMLYHVGSGLSTPERLRLLKDFIGQRIHDPGLQARVAAAAPLIRMEWQAIVLNVVRPEELARKTFAGAKPNELLRERLALARKQSATPPLPLTGGPTHE